MDNSKTAQISDVAESKDTPKDGKPRTFKLKDVIVAADIVYINNTKIDTFSFGEDQESPCGLTSIAVSVHDDNYEEVFRFNCFDQITLDTNSNGVANFVHHGERKELIMSFFVEIPLNIDQIKNT